MGAPDTRELSRYNILQAIITSSVLCIDSADARLTFARLTVASTSVKHFNSNFVPRALVSCIDLKTLYFCAAFSVFMLTERF